MQDGLPNESGLDAWLEKAEALGEVKRITAAVDPHLELATIAYLRGLKRSPALLFENIVGHPGHRVLINVIGNAVAASVVARWEGGFDDPQPAEIEPAHAPSHGLSGGH